MIRVLNICHHRCSLIPSFSYRYLSNTNRPSLTNFDKKTFDYFYKRRLEAFDGSQEQLSSHIRTNIESVLNTSSVINYLNKLNSKNQSEFFSQSISIEQLCDLLFVAYEHNITLDLLTKRLIECVSPINKTIQSNLFIELLNLLVLHQQKYYDFQTKNPNKILQTFLNHLESNLTKDQIENLSLTDLSLLSSAMYRLHLPLININLLEQISQHLIDDEIKRNLSALDKQNMVKILTLSNYGKINVAEALANRFNQSFEQHIQSNLRSFSYEIVRMTMRIAIYFSTFHFYSHRFFTNCLKLIELESNSSKPSYRAKDIIQIMNTLIYMGYIRNNNSKYLDLIHIYDQTNQFDQKPERLVDVLTPMAVIGYFPEHLLEKLFTTEYLNQLTESRFKEKLFFIAQSYKLLCSPEKALLNQNYLNTLPHHIFGSWEIEKRKRPYFSIVMQRLLECVPSRLYVKSAFLLKHFKSPDIIIRLDTEQQPQIIPNEMKKSVSYSDENKNNSSMYALEVLSANEVCINEPFRPLGLFYSKARQLQKLNYTPVIIYPNDSLHQVKTAEEVFKWIVQRAQITELLLNET